MGMVDREPINGRYADDSARHLGEGRTVFAVVCVMNARLTGILFAGVVPAMFVVVYGGSRIVSKYAREAAEYSEKATAVAEGAITAVQVVQAFDAFDRLADEHLEYMKPAVAKGVKKSICGAAMLGLVFFVA
jgi:ATP-binding cassette subfamily B (MDR/TAP) protein 1